MLVCRWVCAILWIALLSTRVFGDDDQRNEVLHGWGAWIDPDGDCTAEDTDSGLVIRVPGSPHDLSSELGRMNAPRVLQEIDGDFIAQVYVEATQRPAGESLIGARTPYNGSGLLLYFDDDHYVRLERAAVLRDGQTFSYVGFERRYKGEVDFHHNVELGDKPVYLRLELRSGQVFGSVSTSGTRWTPLEPFAVPVDKRAKAKIGLAAINSASLPFTAEFKELAIYKKVEAGRKAAEAQPERP